MVRILRYVTVVISLLISCYYAAAQNVEVVSCGEGSNKQEAEYNALRNALESSCGVFLDAHTEMVDDVLTEDRISIISKGSVASFKELSSYVDESCRYHVTMSVTIGMNKMAEMLSESVVEKSGAVEVDLSSLSNVYKFNQKQMELNKENERRIVDALMEDVGRILRIGGDFSDIYNTSIKVGKPLVNNDGSKVKYTVTGVLDVSSRMKMADTMIASTFQELTRINLDAIRNQDEGLAVEKLLSAPTYRGKKNIKVYLTSIQYSEFEKHLKSLVELIAESVDLVEDGSTITSIREIVPLGGRGSILAKEIRYTAIIVSDMESLGSHSYEIY